jgi:hypothetical protein
MIRAFAAIGPLLVVGCASSPDDGNHDPGPAPKGCQMADGGRSTIVDGPELHVGEWRDLSPDLPFNSGDETNVFTQGIALDPCDSGTLYLSVSSFNVETGFPGVYKTTDGGATWRKVGLLDEPIHIRVDPRDHLHLVAVDGVRGGTEGFWVSRDGGESWVSPAGFLALKDRVFQYDTYDVAVDPFDFDHALVTSHSPWNGYNAPYDPSWGGDSGILETKDGGDTWTLRGPLPGWGPGNGVWFLDDSDTWLFGSQSHGFFRTTNGGESFQEVASDVGMAHGGGGVYRTSSGTWYAAAVPHLMRSTDGGASWEQTLGPNAYFNTVIGDGTTLYANPNGRVITSPESDGTTWTESLATDAQFGAGAFEMVYDDTNGIVYGGMWGGGVRALRVR